MSLRGGVLPPKQSPCNVGDCFVPRSDIRKKLFWTAICVAKVLYLVTDLMHLRPVPAIPLWYDALMLFTFALTGLLLGLHSLAMMQNLVSGRYGDTIGWLFALLTMSLSSFGVYIGRFLRWNSWDLLANPVSLLSDVAQHLSQPQLTLRTAVLSLSLNALLLFVYTLLYTRSTQMVVRHPG